jgi:hypothetical protein
VVGEVPDLIINAAKERLGTSVGLGVTWAGTKALMWAIEKRLDREPGLYRWTGATGSAADFETHDLRAAPAADPGKPKSMLVFVHGSSTQGAATCGRDPAWSPRRGLTGGISRSSTGRSPRARSPTLELAAALPDGANVSWSPLRGGLRPTCACDFDALIAGYKHAYRAWATLTPKRPRGAE